MHPPRYCPLCFALCPRLFTFVLSSRHLSLCLSTSLLPTVTQSDIFLPTVASSILLAFLSHSQISIIIVATNQGLNEPQVRLRQGWPTSTHRRDILFVNDSPEGRTRVYVYMCGPGSSVGIATDYGLEGP